ncbi:hypothetical protein J437_LFUL009724 [Ladona fulva]|uniref:Uncharacterized protein n=1 Tax=Ladona fulva TaxID=123851 RepID=A0A8K0K698_LADFU|nr:hypothetical protein J437_LFUL009724 [Ladona fulva]
MIDHFPFEYMHLVCLGVMQKILYSVMKGTNYEVCLSATFLDQLKFGRKPQTLQELLRCKATVFRQILLHRSPLAYPKFLSDDVYNISFLCIMLFEFLKFSLVYSLTSLPYNVHGLLHLMDDVELHRPLDKFIAFKFENKLQKLNKFIGEHDKPLQQIARRISEKEMATKGKEHFKITKKRPYSCVVMENGDICMVQLIANKFEKLHFSGQRFKDVSDFYSKPGSSQVIGIHCAKVLSQAQLFPISEIKNKALMIPVDPHNGNASFYIAEMLHSS